MIDVQMYRFLCGVKLSLNEVVDFKYDYLLPITDFITDYRLPITFIPMHKLNLPSFEYNIKESDGKVWIYDILRKKQVVLTPEEWVRQHFLHYLLNHVHYPKSLIKVEGGLKFNRLQKRSDIVVFDRTGNPWMIVECKAPEQSINESTLRQASVYNATLKAKYLVLTNGMKTFCCQIESENKNTVMLNDLPPFE